MGRNIHGKTQSFAQRSRVFNSTNPLSEEELTRDTEGAGSKIFTNVDSLKNIYGENEGILPSIVNNSMDVSNS